MRLRDTILLATCGLLGCSTPPKLAPVVEFPLMGRAESYARDATATRVQRVFTPPIKEDRRGPPGTILSAGPKRLSFEEASALLAMVKEARAAEKSITFEPDFIVMFAAPKGLFLMCDTTSGGVSFEGHIGPQKTPVAQGQIRADRLREFAEKVFR